MDSMFEQVESPLLQRLFRYLTCDEVSRDLEAFMAANCSSFCGELSDIVGEQDLDRFDLYKEYTGLLERQLDDFCKREGHTAREIYQEAELACRPNGDGRPSMAYILLDMLLAATDYRMFTVNLSTFKKYQLARHELSKQSAESKFAEDDEDSSDEDECKAEVEGKVGEKGSRANKK